MLAFTLILLAMTCINVGALMLVQATARAREISVRFALGATRYRVAQQMLLESVAITAVAMLIAIPFSLFGIRTLASLLPQANVERAIRTMQFDANLMVLIVMGAVALLVSVTTSLAPSLLLV